jgi:hypothetical protein
MMPVFRIRIRDPVPPESGMNKPDHISDSLQTIFGLKYLNSLMRIRIRNNFLP